MTFIYELDPFFLEVYRMCKMKFLCPGFRKLSSHRQTGPKLYTTPLRWWSTRWWWMMMVCGAVCDEGRYGLNCSGVCDCADGSTCDPVTGGCRCGLGQTGARCELACDGQHYGQNCSKRCECGEHGRSCDAVTGCCRCLQGWYGPRCQHGRSAMSFLLTAVCHA